MKWVVRKNCNNIDNIPLMIESAFRQEVTDTGKCSGGTDGAGKVARLASYDGQPYIIDECGGLPWIKAQDRQTSWGYGEELKNKDDFYDCLQKEMDAIRSCKNVCGFCYTQLTDVEQEKNGIYYYDRTPKFDVKRIKAIFKSVSNTETKYK